MPASFHQKVRAAAKDEKEAVGKYGEMAEEAKEHDPRLSFVARSNQQDEAKHYGRLKVALAGLRRR